MADFFQSMSPVLAGVLYFLIAILCIGAIGLSCVSLSGTWVVLLAAVLAILIPDKDYPGFWPIFWFALLCIGVEVIEAIAGAWGVRKRGGSKMAGFVAFAGGLIGLVLGTVLIPIPVIGSLLGMIIVSFVLVYLVENKRLQKTEHAAHVAWGTVMGRVFVLLLKVGVTLGMIAVLWIGLLKS
jgi:uncharacterized protein YqgC (DUF456 family)